MKLFTHWEAFIGSEGGCRAVCNRSLFSCLCFAETTARLSTIQGISRDVTSGSARKRDGCRWLVLHADQETTSHHVKACGSIKALSTGEHFCLRGFLENTAGRDMVEVCVLEESLKWCLKGVKTYDLKRLCGKRYRPFRRQASGVNLLVFAIGQEFIL